jgi:succinate dehydrogenase / fumarate reductase, flavoprotein subunit
MSIVLDSKIPSGPLEQKWSKHKMDSKLINPANKRKFSVIVVGSGLAGGAAAASLAELGYQVKCFCYQDSPRRAHSIAAQGGINAAKNYQNDGDSVRRLFYDTIKGGDFRAREGQRLSPRRGLQRHHRPVRRPGRALRPRIRRPARQPLVRRFPGLPHLLRPRPDRPATPHRLLPGARKGNRRGGVKMYSRTEMLDVVLVDGHAKGIVVRDLATGKISTHAADAVILATGGYGNVFFLSTNAMGCNVTAAWRAAKRGASSPTPASPRSTRPASRSAATTSRSSP